MVKEIRGRSGAGSVPVHGLAPQNLSPDKHVDVCVDSDEDRGSIPLASTFALRAKVSAVALAKADGHLAVSLPSGFQPFTPKLRSAVRICTRILVKRAHKRGTLCCVRRLPVSGFIRLKHVIAMTQNLLTADNVLQRHAIRISEHVIKHHKRGGASQTRFTVKMRPCAGRKRTDSQNKSVHFIIERSRVVGDDDADITRASALDNIALNARTLDCHLLRWNGIAVAVFHRVTRPNIKFAPRLKRCYSRSFIGLNFALTSTYIRPVA